MSILPGSGRPSKSKSTSDDKEIASFADTSAVEESKETSKKKTALEIYKEKNAHNKPIPADK